jgi:hypothetical protein
MSKVQFIFECEALKEGDARFRVEYTSELNDRPIVEEEPTTLVVPFQPAPGVTLPVGSYDYNDMIVNLRVVPEPRYYVALAILLLAVVLIQQALVAFQKTVKKHEDPLTTASARMAHFDDHH